MSNLIDIMHLLPDLSLERLVDALTAEMRRRTRRDGRDEDQLPF